MPFTKNHTKRADDPSGTDFLTLTTVAGEVQSMTPVDAVGDPIEPYTANDIDDAGANVYIGFENAAGAWKILKIISDAAFRYATIVNNSAVSTYAAAWAGRASLTYDYWLEAK